MRQPCAPRPVILDWIIPGIDGVEVIHRVRAIVSDQPPHVIILTASCRTAPDRGQIAFATAGHE
jgi:DNA-binding response OmpR family regulator